MTRKDSDKTGTSSAPETSSAGGDEPKRWFGLSSSLLWALLFSLIIVVWALTGDIKGGARLSGDGVQEGGKALSETNLKNSEQKQGNDSAGGVAGAPFKVRTAVFDTRSYAPQLIIRGRTYSDNQVDVQVETAGKVVALPAAKGAFVKKGAVLCQLDDGARAALAKEAKALVAQRGADYKAAQQLEKRGFAASLRVLQTKALYDQATAALERAELDLARTRIKAPFDGYVETQPAKIGSFLPIGGTCARMVALDPLLVIGAVRERDIRLIQPDMKAEARLVTGEEAVGRVRFISATAEEQTRTFRIELEIDNPEGRLKSGVTADIIVPLAAKPAMLIPPSILTLSDEGVVGLRLVNKGREVEFRPVEILSEQPEGLWIKALPLSSTVITVGQDYVKAGQTVVPVDDPDFQNKPAF